MIHDMRKGVWEKGVWEGKGEGGSCISMVLVCMRDGIWYTYALRMAFSLMQWVLQVVVFGGKLYQRRSGGLLGMGFCLLLCV